MIIHFFTDRSSKRLDYAEFIDGYLSLIGESTSNDNVYCCKVLLRNFNYSYTYYIAKVNPVSTFYRLNPNYTNTNLYVEISPLVPQYITRLILKQISEMCERFGFAIYTDALENIFPFDMFELISLLGKERNKYISEHEDQKFYRLPMNKLNEICIFQQNTDYLLGIKENTVVNPYSIMVEKGTGKVKLCFDWVEGNPTIIPPHLDYVCVKEEESIVSCIPIEVFMKYAERRSYEIKNNDIELPLLFVSESAAKHLKRKVKKMQKTQVFLANFDFIKLTDLIEE